ncbi:hypothetical protein WICMUC_001283 [Wickerhamomyces mucosus]|uniref:Uncharacterized protein n=1 Tax=Wickerhamomyces mucosus TaxID=1378264 RepID=A0A9P8PVT3_9ASCO|nr:hypothetical protein WICMUC_001283 [Wickerhamomyces mucosus]
MAPNQLKQIHSLSQLNMRYERQLQLSYTNATKIPSLSQDFNYCDRDSKVDNDHSINENDKFKVGDLVLNARNKSNSILTPTNDSLTIKPSQGINIVIKQNEKYRWYSKFKSILSIFNCI